MKTTQHLSHPSDSANSKVEQAVNANWLAFFRRVRELAELARQREADSAARQLSALCSEAAQSALPPHSP